MSIRPSQAARLLFVWLASMTAMATLSAQAREFTRDFPITKCTFSTTGRTPYFVLEPGHTLVLEDGKGVQLTVSVLDRTESVGGVLTRVIEERQIEKGKLVEISLNYFAICAENNSVFYFGEFVDNYKDGKVINHDGAWRHGSNGATAGLMMPALPLLGARYHQPSGSGSGSGDGSRGSYRTKQPVAHTVRHAGQGIGHGGNNPA